MHVVYVVSHNPLFDLGPIDFIAERWQVRQQVKHRSMVETNVFLFPVIAVLVTLVAVRSDQSRSISVVLGCISDEIVEVLVQVLVCVDRKSTRLNSSHAN